jgi:enterochelin esterase-like enzyme
LTSISESRQGPQRLIAAIVVAAAAAAATLPGTQPAVAAAAPWLTVSDGFASFTVPASDIQNTMGQVSGVVVEGNFGPSFNLAELGLTLSGNAWTAMIGPLPAGLYYYRFTGDDTKTIKDPTNPTTVTSEPTWSTFLVPGDSASLIAEVPRGRGGAVKTVNYPSLARKGSAIVWTPPGYDARRVQPYPVLYLLGGSGADWSELGRAKQILDNLSVQGRLEPMVVVMGDGNVSDFRGELKRIMEVVRRDFNLAQDPAHQALAGVSTGGTLTVKTALSYPGEFAYVGSFSGLFSDDVSTVDAQAVNAGTTLLRLYTGNLTDPAYNPSYRLIRQLEVAGVRYEFDGVNPDAGHNWKAWQKNLADFVPRLFRTTSDPRPTPGHATLDHEFTTPAAGTTPTPWLSRDSNGNAFVTVETTTEYANAKHVTLWGNWAPGGSWVNVPLSRNGNRWRVTVGPLKPWFYYYKFLVDLASKKDTSNPTRVTTESTWSTFLVPGEQSRLLADVPKGQGGTVETLSYDSKVAGQKRMAYVWKPPGYDPRRAAPYPVLYLQHGGGQNYTDWVEMGRAKQILDNLSVQGRLAPMVVVMGNGNVSDFTKELLENIVPAARATYHISRDPGQQALAGLSMGGFQTYDVLKSNPGKFAYIGTFSAAVLAPTGFNVAAVNSGTRLLRVYTGNVTDFVYPMVMSTLTTFDSLGIRYEFAGVTEGPHGWDAWQKNLIDFAPRLFRTSAS